MSFTAEQRKKGLETRRRNKELKAARQAKSEAPHVLARRANDKPEIISEKIPRVFLLPDAEAWNLMSVPDAESLVQKLQACYEEGARIINQKRYEQTRNQTYRCLACNKIKAMLTGNGGPNYVWRDDRKDQTGIYTSRFICSQECWMRGQSEGKLTSAALRNVAGQTFRQEDSPKPRKTGVA